MPITDAPRVASWKQVALPIAPSPTTTTSACAIAVTAGFLSLRS
jgi:hypothetical protein